MDIKENKTNSNCLSNLFNVVPQPSCHKVTRPTDRRYKPDINPPMQDTLLAFPSVCLATTNKGKAATALTSKSDEQMERILAELTSANKKGYAGALIVIRLNDFRLLEETYGKRIAEKLNLQVAEQLNLCLRGDELLEQVAVDEYVIVPDRLINIDHGACIAERLMDGCSQCYIIDEIELSLQCGAGIAQYLHHSNEPVELIRFARIALRQGEKAKATRCHVFENETLNCQKQQLSIAVELEQAIAMGNLVLHYQPQYLLHSEKITGVEALVRLKSVSGELLSANDFISIAEQNGQIIPLGNWVIKEACQQMRRWRDAGCAPEKVSVNVSPQQLVDDRLIDVVTQAVTEAGIDYSELTIEITEQCSLDNFPMAERVLKSLADKGVCLSVDDFGTGYSSLAYITRFPISYLKMDRSLLQNIPGDRRACQVFQALLSMASSLDLKVIAEGIETKAQSDFLNHQGCILGQGFSFARPCSAEACQVLLLL